MVSQRNLAGALWDDARFALRTLRKNAGFTAVVLATLALGIGANTAIFGLMDQVMLRPLPVRDPERLVVFHAPGEYSGHTSNNSSTLTPMSHPMFEGIRDRATAFSGVFAYRASGIHLAYGTRTQNASAALVSGGFFPTLGLRPAMGRLLGPEDDRTAGGHPVVVVSHRLFRTRLASDPALVGSAVSVNGQPMTVVGVAPAEFEDIEVGAAIDVFVPLAMEPTVQPTWPVVLGNWRSRWLTVMARLKDGETAASAEAAVNVVYAQLLQEDLKTVATALSERSRTEFLGKRIKVLPGRRGISSLRDDARTPLAMLMGMVGLVLLIACANVANLLLARGAARQKELAVRLAIGAGRARLMRQLLVESLLLSLGGGLLGLLVAAWAGQALIAALPFEAAARTLIAEPDLRVGLFAFALAVVTGLGFGLLPALQATRLAVAATLKAEAGTVAGASRSFRFRRGLVVAQIALSLLLLVGAGLLTRSLANLRTIDPGFRPEHLVTLRVDPSLSGYVPDRRQALFDRLREELRSEPGVQAVSMADTALLDNSDNSSTVIVEGYTAREDEDMNPNFNRVGPEFFATMGMPLVRGRDIADADRKGATKAAVVNETFARYFFGDQDPIGRRFGRARFKVADTEIVGVVRDGKTASLREEPLRFAYLASAQADMGEMTFYVRTAGDPEPLVGRIPHIVRRVDAALPVGQVRTMQAQIRQSLYVERLVAMLSAAFGLLATLLAALGLYGVMAYVVSQRTREIGIRMALGAARGDVVKMVLLDVAFLVALGVACGLPGGYGLGRVIEAQLFGLSARDPLTFGAAVAVLLFAAASAAYLPARRATRVDPLIALRS